MPRYIADGMESCAANLPSPLGDFICHGEKLVAVLVQQEMIIPEVPSAHVPVEILCFQVQREDVRQQFTECARYLRNSVAAEVNSMLGPLFKLDCAFAHDF